MELTKILKDEAWLEGERQNKPVPLSDPKIFNKSIKIWNAIYKKLPLAQKNSEEV